MQQQCLKCSSWPTFMRGSGYEVYRKSPLKSGQTEIWALSRSMLQLCCSCSRPPFFGSDSRIDHMARARPAPIPFSPLNYLLCQVAYKKLLFVHVIANVCEAIPGPDPAPKIVVIEKHLCGITEKSNRCKSRPASRSRLALGTGSVGSIG
jgi:hypothetical protein